MGRNHDQDIDRDVAEANAAQPMSSQKLATLLRSAASALEHGRHTTADKKLAQILAEVSKVSATGPVICMEGGIVQDVFVLDASAPNGFRDVAHTLIDYDIFEGYTTAKEIREYWNGYPAQLQEYIRTKLPYEYGLFQDAIKEVELGKDHGDI